MDRAGRRARGGGPYAPLRRLIQREAQLHETDKAMHAQKLGAWVARHGRSASLRRVIEFIGEMTGVHFPDESLPLAAARAIRC